MRRLYIGGLGHSVTEKNLKDRFGKFGDVQDVELRTRKDDEGVPYKTFAYININIEDGDLKKCMTVLNKSKWKGGTLQIEMAKESFLHRLAEERQTLAEQHLQQPAAEDKRQKMLDSMSSAGVDNFTMKAAVPGTEIPGHKDWVVSKFGRVLPILQLHCQNGSRARTMKYDPSKYSHNIRRLDRATQDQVTPVSQLTWEVQGGDDDISKKRRGEFPPYVPSRPKKGRTDAVSSHKAVDRTRFKPTSDSVVHTEARPFTNGYGQSTNHRLAQRRRAVNDSDVDSDEEIHRMVAAQSTSYAAPPQEAGEDNLEVVGLDYMVKSRQQLKAGSDDEGENDYDSADTDELFASRKTAPPPQERLTQPAGERLSAISTDGKKKTKKKSEVGEGEDSADEEDHLTSTQQRQRSGKQRNRTDMKVLPVLKPPVSDSDSDDDDEHEDEDEGDDEELDSTDCSSDSDYEAMFSNVTHLEISLADLQSLAQECQEDCETPAPSILCVSPNQKSAPKKGILPEEILATLMEDSSGDEQEENKKRKKRKSVMSTPLPVFQGSRTLKEGSETEENQRIQKDEDGGRGSEFKKQKLELDAPHLKQKATDQTSMTLSGGEQEKKEEDDEEEDEEEEEQDDDDEEEENDEDVATSGVLKVVPTNTLNNEKAETGLSSSTDNDDDEEEVEEESMKATKTVLTAKVETTKQPSSSGSSSEEDKDKQELISTSSEEEEEEEEDDEEEEEEKQAPPRKPLAPEEEAKRQRKANMRRLAAVQQRQKEAEEHKKLIQGALAKLDAPTAGAGKHIVFGSDDDDEEDGDGAEKQQVTSETPNKTLFSQSEDEDMGDEALANKKSARKVKETSVPQLFSGSEDEDGDEEVDASRFDIRPEFEGRAGQKLMALQSRFGTDERFRMDSRFLEEDKAEEEDSERTECVMKEEEALEDEKKKNLSILQSVLSSSTQTSSSKTAGKAKTFRDVSALHYDPSREEHAAFETKTAEPKESKAARRKKREEAQKLPEVSKEIYYDVSGDLKAVFGQAKEEGDGGEEKASWDQEEVEEGEEEEEEEEEGKEEQPALLSSLFPSDPSAEKEMSSGFKFSFFGDDTEAETLETEYKVGSIQEPKVSWQKDSRFHDSSSDEEEEERVEDEEQSSIVAKTAEEETPSKTDLFFFYAADGRLTDGPRSFCRSSHLEEQREQWEERRSALRQEYRKKHKDARRKLKASQKS